MSDHHTHIRSAFFNNCYLRLDGRGVTRPADDGGGLANCQFGIGPYETFSEVTHPEGLVSFRSLAFEEVFLRMDARNATAPRDEGSGLVNGQFGRGPFETFAKVENADKTHSFRSTTVPNVFLRMDGRGVVASQGPGAGRVNCQLCPNGQPGPYEKFVLEHCIDPSEADRELEKIAALFPKEAERIAQNRQPVVRRCCPPYAAPQTVPSSVLFVGSAIPQTRTVLSPRADAAIDVALNAIGTVFSLFGIGMTSAMRSRLYRMLGPRVATLVDIVRDFVDRWVGSAWDKAKVFYDLVKECWDKLNLHEMMLNALDGMTWWEWILAGVRIGAEVASWFLSNGSLLLAKVILFLLDVKDLVLSIVNCQRVFAEHPAS